MKITEKYRASWIVSLILSPVSILSILYLLAAFTIGNMFTLKFTITNQTDTLIQVTPFGHFKSSPEYLRLPLSYWHYPSFTRVNQSRIAIQPGESKEFFYDADNLYLKGFLIQTTEFSKIMEFERAKNEAKYLISNLHDLPDIPETIESKLTDKSSNIVFYLIWLFGLINAIIIFKTYRNRKRITVHNTR